MWSVNTRPNFRSASGGRLWGFAVRSNGILAGMAVSCSGPRQQTRAAREIRCRPLRSREPRAALLAHVADAPDGLAAVVGDQQRAVARDGDAHRPPPHAAVARGEAGEKILVLAAGSILPVQRHPDHLVAGALGAVPGSVLGGEDVAP